MKTSEICPATSRCDELANEIATAFGRVGLTAVNYGATAEGDFVLVVPAGIVEDVSYLLFAPQEPGDEGDLEAVASDSVIFEVFPESLDCGHPRLENARLLMLASIDIPQSMVERVTNRVRCFNADRPVAMA